MEAWRRIPGWPDYEVSDRGRVRALARVVVKSNGQVQPVPEQEMALHLDQYGYVIVGLRRRAGERSTQKVHRLVLSAFVGPCPEGHECDHINAKRDDNRVANLRWVTCLENARHRATLGRQLYGKTHGRAKLRDADVLHIREQLEQGQSQTAIARLFGIGQSTVSRIYRGEAWAHVEGGAS